MPVSRRRAQSNGRVINGLYIHSSPPRVLQLSSAHLKQLIRNGDIDKLEQAVLEGQGKKLVGEYSADYKTRTFLKSIPSLMSKMSLLHDAVNSGRLEELQSILEEEPEKKKKLVLAKDDSGVGLLHKAVYYDLQDIYSWLIQKFPHMVALRDAEGRTAYHYTPMCKDPQNAQKLLTNAGTDPSCLDVHQHSAKYYMDHKQELELPSGEKSPTKPRKSVANNDSLNFKKSNIRIWIHQRNLTNLQQVVWEGHGSKLLVEHSNNPKIKKFLEAVPHIMGLIKDIHTDVQSGDLDSLKNHVSPPIPPMVLSGKDANGLTPLHKAVGLAKYDIAEYIINEYPSCINATDNEGRTPLHYAALLKDDGKMTNFLIEHGADESALDSKQKTAAYYKTRNSELDSKLLNVVPECPRSAKENFAAHFDWSMLASSLPLNGVKEIVHKAEKLIENATENNNTTNSEEKEEGNENGKDEEHNKDDEAHAEIENKEDNNNEDKVIDNEEKPNEQTTANVNGVESKSDEPTENNNEINGNEEVKNDEHEASNDEVKNNDESNNEIEETTYNSDKDKEEISNDNNEAGEDPFENNSKFEKNGEQATENTDSRNSPDVTTNEEINETEEELEKQQPEKSRPSSTINSTTRPISQTEPKSRPSSQVKSRPSSEAKSRPSSKVNSNTRPNSQAVEKDETHYENHKPPEPLVEGEGIIEGVVNGEDEVETLNNEGQNQRSVSSIESDAEIKTLVNSGNMEQLATLVLNGQGEKLAGQTSDNPELQSFLENVPVYMSKINRIHEAARNGSLRDLQAALDRRKFAIAKDPISPNGASPLHVAVIFGNTSIVRYLAGRFPETVQVIDDNGRTPLHYAAVLSDNGHYYNLLVHLGADTTTQDKFGHTAEYYRKNQSDFSHRSVLKEFGAEEQEADEILTDKVPADTFSARKDMDDEDMLVVLERCYTVLHGRRSSNVSASSIGTISSIISSSPMLNKHIRKHVFDTVKHRLTKLDHNLYDVIWPSVKKLPTDMSFRTALEQDFPIGIVAPDFYVYKVFKEFLEPIIKDYNAIDLHHKLQVHPGSKFVEQTTEGDKKFINVDMDLDPNMKWIISDNVTPDNGQVDMPFFATEEGRYLASSLGDPLIKGLTEVANKRPDDPIAYLAQYLYNFANTRNTVKSRGRSEESQHIITGSPAQINDNKAVPASIDVVTVEPDDNNSEDESAFSNTSRDEHGQSMLHFAAARAHGRNALFQLLLETEINVAFRDELYRTARDISIQANIPENTEEIDRYVLHIATKGDTDKLVELLLDGYDHITDIVDDEDVPIIEAVSKANQTDTMSFLQSILAFEEKRERVHHAIRQGSINDVTALLADENETGSGKLLAIGKNNYGRCTLHIAVLCQQEEIVDFLANTFPETLKLGDNLERTALHYAMGVEKMEVISRVLIKAGARRVTKDLKGRQPTYYFLNKSEILRLQEEEETF